MPTYEYRCSAGHAFEQFQRMSEEPVRVCPTCGAPAERLLSTGAGLLFKGSGFYITDYRSDAYRKAAAADSSGKDSSSGGGSADAGTSSGEGGKGAGEGGKGAGEGGKAGGSGADPGPKNAPDKGGSGTGGGGASPARGE